jgi:photosystem II stability/assembly factor-like uncharacterized protein
MKYILLILFIIAPFSLHSEKKTLVQKRYANSGRWALQCLDSMNCFAADGLNPNLNMVQTTDGGETWIEKFSVPHKDIYINSRGTQSGYVLDENHMYFASDQFGIIAYTSDGGKTFGRTEMGTFANGAKFMNMMDTLNGIVVHGSGITVTHDGWKTWTDIVTWVDGRDGNHIILNHAIPRSDSIYYVTSTYNQGTFEEPEYIKSLFEFNMYTFEIDILYLFPGHPDDTQRLYGPILHFPNDSIGFYGGSVKRTSEDFRDVVIWKTTDGGKSWHKVLDHYNWGSWGAEDLAMRDSLYGIIASRPDRLYETFDGGESWELVMIEHEESHTLMFVEFAGQEAIIGSWGNGMYKWEEPADTVDTGINDKSNHIRVEHKNNHLFIFSEFNNLNISIYDMRSQLWIDEKIFQNGNINLLNLQNGVYFYNISTIGQIVKTGKFSVKK